MTELHHHFWVSVDAKRSFTFSKWCYKLRRNKREITPPDSRGLALRGTKTRHFPITLGKRSKQLPHKGTHFWVGGTTCWPPPLEGNLVPRAFPFWIGSPTQFKREKPWERGCPGREGVPTASRCIPAGRGSLLLAAVYLQGGGPYCQPLSTCREGVPTASRCLPAGRGSLLLAAVYLQGGGPYC